jgi:hypothetical protein
MSSRSEIIDELERFGLLSPEKAAEAREELERDAKIAGELEWRIRDAWYKQLHKEWDEKPWWKRKFGYRPGYFLSRRHGYWVFREEWLREHSP